MSPGTRTCEGCDRRIYESGGGWRTSGGPTGGICGMTFQEARRIAPQYYGTTDWLFIRQLERQRPHYPLNMRAPDSVERWLAS